MENKSTETLKSSSTDMLVFLLTNNDKLVLENKRWYYNKDKKEELETINNIEKPKICNDLSDSSSNIILDSSIDPSNKLVNKNHLIDNTNNKNKLKKRINKLENKIHLMDTKMNEYEYLLNRQQYINYKLVNFIVFIFIFIIFNYLFYKLREKIDLLIL